jgi:hypothetical protein
MVEIAPHGLFAVIDPQIAEIARKLSEAEQEVLLSMRWFYPGGQEPLALVNFEAGLQDAGLCRAFSLHFDRLTPLGQSVAAYLKEQSNER